MGFQLCTSRWEEAVSLGKLLFPERGRVPSGGLCWDGEGMSLSGCDSQVMPQPGAVPGSGWLQSPRQLPFVSRELAHPVPGTGKLPRTLSAFLRATSASWHLMSQRVQPVT